MHHYEIDAELISNRDNLMRRVANTHDRANVVREPTESVLGSQQVNSGVCFGFGARSGRAALRYYMEKRDYPSAKSWQVAAEWENQFFGEGRFQGNENVHRAALTVVADSDLTNANSEFRALLQSAIDDTHLDLDDAQRLDSAASARTFRSGLVLAAVWTGTLVLLAAGGRYWLGRPLRNLAEATQAIARGEVATRAPVSGPRELAEVGEDVNRMADALLRRSEELNQYLERDLSAKTTELSESQTTLERTEQRIQRIAENTSVGIYQLDEQRRPMYLNAAACAMLELADEEEARQYTFERFFTDESLETMRLEQAKRARGMASTYEIEIVGLRGRRCHALVSGAVLNVEGQPQSVVGTIVDITDRKQYEASLPYAATHDSLTGLANRARFSDRLEHALLKVGRSEFGVAVLFLDLDDFKSINDTLGHAAGDELLVEVTQRLACCVRTGDTVARLGGDEFAVLVEDARSVEDAVTIARQIVESLRQPVKINGIEIRTRASIGISMTRETGMATAEVLRNADVAMYAAKTRSKGAFEIYDASMEVSMVQRLELLADLERALENDEFVLHYQPTVRLSTDEVVGAEALVRWAHPTRGLLPPLQFIGLAEESGAIVPLGRWVLNEACRAASQWQSRFSGEDPFTIGVNVSVRQLLQADFVNEVAQAIEHSGMDPRGLVLEVTESVMMNDARRAADVLRRLKELGLKLAIDDFGTGYSSLSYLHEFPFDVLKIDKTFVDPGDDQHAALERAIVDLGRTLQLEIIAEGIELPEQAARLRSLNCDFGQGYFFAKALPSDEMSAYLASRKDAVLVA